MTEMELLSLKPVKAAEAYYINHFIYCHNCQRMNTMRLLGRDSWGQNVFACPRRMHDPRGFVLDETCGGMVCLKPAGVEV